MNNELIIVGFIALIIALIICVPLLVIWSLNVLFALSIPPTLKTWFAALVLGGVVGGSSVRYTSD